jgi:hypothetical protein
MNVTQKWTCHIKERGESAREMQDREIIIIQDRERKEGGRRKKKKFKHQTFNSVLSFLTHTSSDVYSVIAFFTKSFVLFALQSPPQGDDGLGVGYRRDESENIPSAPTGVVQTYIYVM